MIWLIQSLSGRYAANWVYSSRNDYVKDITSFGHVLHILLTRKGYLYHRYRIVGTVHELPKDFKYWRSLDTMPIEIAYEFKLSEDRNHLVRTDDHPYPGCQIEIDT